MIFYQAVDLFESCFHAIRKQVRFISSLGYACDGWMNVVPKRRRRGYRGRFKTNFQIDLLDQGLKDANSALDSFSITLFSIVIIALALRENYPKLTDKGLDVAAFFSKRCNEHVNACCGPHVLLPFL